MSFMEKTLEYPVPDVVVKDTKQSRKRAVTVERILTEAYVFSKQDRYVGFSLRQLAGRMDMRVSNIQYYFPQAMDLLAALFEKFIEKDAGDLLKHYCQASGNPEKRLKSALDLLLNDEDYLDGCELFMSEMAALAKSDTRIAQSINVYFEKYHASVELLIKEINPELKQPWLREKALLIVAQIEGALRIRGPLEDMHKGKMPRILARASSDIIHS
jgi:AcrR family transcriptional regulator